MTSHNYKAEGKKVEDKTINSPTTETKARTRTQTFDTTRRCVQEKYDAYPKNKQAKHT